MTHDELVGEVQRGAKARGILSHYCGAGLRCQGDRGMPDLLLVGKFKAAFVEVKTQWDRLKPDQITWKHALVGAGQQHHVIRPEQIDDGTLDRILDELAFGQPTLFGAA